MSIEAPERTAELEVQPPVAESLPADQAPPHGEGTREQPKPADEGEQPVSILLTSVAIFLSVAAAGWMASGVFRGGFAKAVAVLGATIGVGIIGLSYRTRRPSIVQYLALPAAVIVGAILVLPDAKGGTANLPSLVSEAIRTGGVAQPPIPFDPGWRFILVLLTAVLGAAAASLATGLNKPKVGVFIPVPLLFGAALLQPKEGSLVSIGVALVLFVAALAVSYGVELAQEGATSGQFEARRLIRGVGVLALLMVVLAGLSQVGFLFPEPKRQQVVPPKKPEPQPPQPDRVLFTVKSDRNIPWRLGVLDVYDGEAWLLPPYDTSRFLEVPRSGKLPRGKEKPEATPAPASLSVTTREQPAPARDRMQVTFEVADIEGHVIPTIADAERIKRSGFEVTYDPRTQMLRLPEKRATRGMTYVMDAPVPATGKELATAPPPPDSTKEFLDAPPPPEDVSALLNQAPTTNLFDRLQFVRNAFYQSVVAAGAGQPVDLPPSRVSDMLAGKEASPYEITAAEALLARWAGIPARIGYGFYGGDKPDPASPLYEVHPKHGSTWLEVYFENYGWVPIVGIPPKAKASLSQQQKKDDPEVRPTQELALIVYVPIKLQSIQLLFVTVRYWLAVTLPLLAALLLLWAVFPGVLKVARRFRRRRWAHGRGLRDRIAVAYAEFRDVVYDLNIGDPAATPLEFRRYFETDDEHSELAWLVTRCLWGDLSRDLQPADAESAEDMAQSVTRRVRRAQSAMTRVLGFGARASLRDPYSTDIPNLWPAWLGQGTVRRAVRARLRRVRPIKRLRKLLPVGAGLLVLALLTGACAQEPTARAGKLVMPDRIVPDSLDRFAFHREEDVERSFKKAGRAALVGDGRVFTVRSGNDIEAYLQVASFKPGLGAGRKEVREGVLENIGSGRFQLKRVGKERIWVAKVAEQSFYVWFPPSGRYFELLVARQGFEQADRLFAALLAFQRGETSDIGTPQEQQQSTIDPRRGGDL